MFLDNFFDGVSPDGFNYDFFHGMASVGRGLDWDELPPAFIGTASSLGARGESMGLPEKGIQLQDAPGTLNIVYTCGYGDTCQWIGCLAHPYNDATQEYVRSAPESMNTERPASELYNNPQPPADGNVSSQPPPANPISPRATHTPNARRLDLTRGRAYLLLIFSSSTTHLPRMDARRHGELSMRRRLSMPRLYHAQRAVPYSGGRESCPCGAYCQYRIRNT